MSKKKKEAWKNTAYPGLKVSSNGRYKVRVGRRVPDSDKIKQVQKVLPSGTSETDALRVLAELRELVLDEVDPTFDRVTSVTDYAVRWFESEIERARASTTEYLESVLRLHILPQLGEHNIHNLRRSDVARWVADAEQRRKPNGERYSGKTVNSWWRVLTRMLRDAVADLELEHDPITRVKPPRSARRSSHSRERRTLTAEQLGSLVAVTKEHYPHRYAELITAAYTGMRAGELYGLRWEDIDTDRQLIHVRRSVSRGQVNATKTGEPRIVVVPGVVITALQEHRGWLLREQHPGLSMGVCFPSDRVTHRHPSSLNKLLAPCCTLAGIEQHVTAQVLRRTYNTLLSLARVDRLVVRAQMGHSSEQMTAWYADGGVPVEARREAVQGLVVTPVVTEE